MGDIARAAWVDVALWDHAALYLALVSTHPYLREIMPSLAWTYVFCRSRQDFALYLHLRFGSVLSESKRHVQHAEMHLSERHILRRGFRGQVVVKYPKLSHDTLTAAFEAIENDELLLPTPMTAIYSSSPDAPHPLGAHPILSPAHADAITDLQLVNTYFDAEWHRRHHVYRSLTRLTIVHVAGRMSDWTTIAPRFKQTFPALRFLTLRGGFAAVQSLLPLLPQDLDELVPDVQFSHEAGTSSVHFYDLLPALKAGLKVGGGERAPHVILLTGAEKPYSWQEAVAIADEKGVRLECRIEYRPPCRTSATLRPVSYDLNVVFRDL
jgi:hypothetical protein